MGLPKMTFELCSLEGPEAGVGEDRAVALGARAQKWRGREEADKGKEDRAPAWSRRHMWTGRQ